MSYPGSFEGLNAAIETPELLTERLMYYTYIILMAIGCEGITPVTFLAQKVAILIGMIGQFYLVILTAIVVGKYVIKSNIVPFVIKISARDSMVSNVIKVNSTH